MSDPAPTLPFAVQGEEPLGEEEARVRARYRRTYGKRPVAAAQKVEELGKKIKAALARDDMREAHQYASARRALLEVLAEKGRCRRCGRELRDPLSVRLGIGPECRRKAA